MEVEAKGAFWRGRRREGLLESGSGGGEVDLIDIVENVPRVIGKEGAVVVDIGGDRVKGDVEVVD